MISDKQALLIGAYALLSDKKHWRQGLYHSHYNGHHKFCLIGGIQEIAIDDGPPGDANAHLTDIAYKLYGQSAISVNDDRGYKHAMYLLTVAIETAELEQLEQTKIVAKKNISYIAG